MDRYIVSHSSRRVVGAIIIVSCALLGDIRLAPAQFTSPLANPFTGTSADPVWATFSSLSGDPRQICGRKAGCIIVINESAKNWVLIGYYLDLRKDPNSDHPDWQNQLVKPLEPRKWGAMARNGSRRMTAVPVRLVWQNRKSRETVEEYATVDLYDPGDRGVWVQHAKIVRPSVTVEAPQ